MPEPRVPSPAVTPPPGNPRFPLFDSLRAVAVLCILAFHVGSLTGAIGHRVIGDVLGVLGAQAPILFFTISGFLLYRPYVAARVAGRPGPSVLRFARRRALRILPAYWLALTALSLYPGLTGVWNGDWWRYYLLLQDYSSRTIGGGIPTAWTLCVEVAFYAALPLWALLAGRVARPGAGRRWWRTELWALGVPIVIGCAVQIAAARQAISGLLATTPIGECPWFALGMALAVLSVAAERGEAGVRLARSVTRHPLPCWIAAVACLGAAAAVLHPAGILEIIKSLHTVQPYTRTVAGILLTAGFSVGLLVPAVFGDGAGGVPRRVLAFTPLARLGLISYGVYLYHLTAAEWLGQRADPHFSATGLGLIGRVHHLTTPALFIATLLLSAAVAALSYRLVELRFLSVKG